MSVAAETLLHELSGSCNADIFLGDIANYLSSPSGIDSIRRLILELAFAGGLSSDTQYPIDCWETTTVGKLSTRIQPGSACGKQHQAAGGHVHLRTHNVSTNGKLNFDLLIRVDPSKIDPKKSSIKRGDIIFNNTNSQELVGKTCLVDEDYDFAFSNHLTLIRLDERVDSGFFVRYFELLLRNQFFFNLCNRWIGQAGISTKVLKQIEVQFPPLAEQKRIVAKVDSLMGLCDRLEAQRSETLSLTDRSRRSVLASLTSSRDSQELASSWRRLSDHFEILHDRPETLADLRQTILALAVQGKLVKQDPNDEPAFTDSLGNLLREKSLNGYSKQPTDEPRGVPILRISAGTARSDFFVDEADHKWVELTESEIDKFRLCKDDLLACRFNGNLHYVGRFSLFQSLEPRAVVFPDKLIRFRVDQNRLMPRFAVLALNSAESREKIESFCATTAGNIGISATNLKTISLRVPSLLEQKRIVAKVDRLLAQCDRVAAGLRKRQTTTEQLLTASIHRLLADQD